MCTRDRALQLGQKTEVLDQADKEIAEYERIHGKPMSKAGVAMRYLSGLLDVYDKTLLL